FIVAAVGGPECRVSIRISINGCALSIDSTTMLTPPGGLFGQLNHQSFDCPTLFNKIKLSAGFNNSGCSSNDEAQLIYDNHIILKAERRGYGGFDSIATNLVGSFYAGAESSFHSGNEISFNLRVLQDSINPQTIIINGGENFTYDTIFRFIRQENLSQPVVMKTINNDIKFFTITEKNGRFIRKSMDSLVFNEPGIYPFSYQSETEVFYSSIEINDFTPVIKKPDFILHPNPVSDVLNVSVNGVFDYEIYNLTGKIMMKQTGMSSTISVKNL